PIPYSPPPSASATPNARLSPPPYSARIMNVWVPFRSLAPKNASRTKLSTGNHNLCLMPHAAPLKRLVADGRHTNLFALSTPSSSHDLSSQTQRRLGTLPIPADGRSRP